MEESKLYDLIANKLLHKWVDEAKECSKELCYAADEKESFEKLNAKLDDEGKKLLKIYRFALESTQDFINSYIQIKFLNFGVKIGLELNAF